MGKPTTGEKGDLKRERGKLPTFGCGGEGVHGAWCGW